MTLPPSRAGASVGSVRWPLEFGSSAPAHSFFDPEMEAYVNQRAAMEKELRDGIEAQQFVLYYQPQIDGDGQISPSGRGRICPDRPGAG